jgi:hypothetical protein
MLVVRIGIFDGSLKQNIVGNGQFRSSCNHGKKMSDADANQCASKDTAIHSSYYPRF